MPIGTQEERMQIKDIFLHMDGTAQAEVRLRLAIDLARRHDAHLTALYIIDIQMPPIAGGEAAGAAFLAELRLKMLSDARIAATAVEARFRERLRLEGVAGEWRQIEGAATEEVALHARYADLVIVSQDHPDGSQPDADAIIERVLFSAGRPVLIVPHTTQVETVGRRVLIGWNASREATRAVHDALPLIARADAVTVFTVSRRGASDEPGAALALHLARHGIKVQVEHTVAAGMNTSDIMLNAAANLPADLLIVGGYGHSRFRELVLGGVTRTLLRRMTLPVLMSH
jgi:nucleotide-binding universal stress UspA family protein